MTAAPHPLARRALLLLGVALLIALATLGDRWTYAHLVLPGIYDHGWGRMLKTFGFLPFWLVAGIAFYLCAIAPVLRRGALLLMAAPTLGGAVGIGLKLLIRRDRPGPGPVTYIFRSFADSPFDSHGFGLPSVDTMIAFAACAVLVRLWPRAQVVWFTLAAGCALARVLNQAHFLSDVTAGAILGWCVGGWVWRRFAVGPLPPTE